MIYVHDSLHSSHIYAIHKDKGKQKRRKKNQQ